MLFLLAFPAGLYDEVIPIGGENAHQHVALPKGFPCHHLTPVSALWESGNLFQLFEKTGDGVKNPAMESDQKGAKVNFLHLRERCNLGFQLTLPLGFDRLSCSNLRTASDD